jgi:thymidylate synthase
MSKQFSKAYRGLLEDLLTVGHRERNNRTGVGVSVLGPRSFTLDLSDGLLPVPGNRKVYPKTAAAEVAWFLQGRKEVDFIAKYAPIWDKFVEDDGRTVAGAYGYRWRNNFGRDQIADALAALTMDPSDRRIFISAWDPAVDGLGRPSKNVPCPVGFTLSITNGRLNSTLLIRSSDVFVGLPYDVMGHALLMDAFVASYNVGKAMAANSCTPGGTIKLGQLQVSLAHPHMYEKHYDMAAESLLEEPVVGVLKMPDWGLKRIVTLPDGYVKTVMGLAADMNQPDYSCRPEVVQ